MKYFWLSLILVVVLGTSGAWLLNNQRYGGRDTAFGRIKFGGDVNADNVIELVKAGYENSGARAKMLTDEFYDFGAMAPNDKGSQTFVVKNVGTEPLSLKVGSSTCKCTIGSLATDKIDPGEQTDIKIEWTVKTNEKKFSQRAQIITNDPNKVVLDLRISGQVIREFEIVPNKISFGDVAAADSFGWEKKVYSYYKHGIKIDKVFFTSEQVQELADIEVEEFKPSTDDKNYGSAVQGFNIKVNVKPGLRQGPVSTRMMFKFNDLDENGDFVINEESGTADSLYSQADISGRIVGALSVVESKKMRRLEDGSFLYDLGKLKDGDKLKNRILVKLKGKDTEGTKLSVGEVSPAEAVQASFGKPIGRGETVLYPLEVEIVPGDEAIDLTGKNGKEYGSIWIESDNPKVPKMLIAVKFAIDKKAISKAE